MVAIGQEKCSHIFEEMLEIITQVRDNRIGSHIRLARNGRFVV